MRMLKLGATGLLLACFLSSGLAAVTGAKTNSYPPFSELFDLVKKNLADASEAELNQAAVEGLVRQLAPQVRLIEDQATASASAPLLTQTNLYESTYGYVRISNVGNGLASQLRELVNALQKTNQLKGLILDLRFGQGQDYPEAARTADLFLTNAVTLLQWQGRPILSTPKSDAVRFPVMVLVNKETRGAAEVLASILREADVALLIGTTTAGQAAAYKVFTLSNGQKIEIAASPIMVGENQKLTREGLRPDIRVSVSPEDEKAYYQDAYKVIASAAERSGGPLLASSTNRATRPRINEAELVRMQREGINPDDEEVVASSPTVPAAPTLQDPVLLRALDLLKALALRVMR